MIRKPFPLMGLLMTLLPLLAVGTGGNVAPARQPLPESLVWPVQSTLQDNRSPTPGLDSAQMSAPFNSVPAMFIENVGQFPEEARFQVRGGLGSGMWLAEDAIWVALLEPAVEVPDLRNPLDFHRVHSEPQPRKGVNIKLSFVGANPHPRIEPFDRLDTKVSYFFGNDPANWHADVPVWGGVRYVDIYPGVDLELASESGQYSQRMIAHPEADLGAVRLGVEGASILTLDEQHLCLSTALGQFVIPLFQVAGTDGSVIDMGIYHSEIDGTETVSPFSSSATSSRFSSIQDNSSDLLYSTFLGGDSVDVGSKCVVDQDGNIYIGGRTESSGFPTTPGAFDTTYDGESCQGHIACGDAFVTKLSAGGTALIYSSFLGGSWYDGGSSLVVDSDGFVHITGITKSFDFPTTSNAFDRSYDGSTCEDYVCGDAFLTELDADGTALIYSSFLGGNDYEWSYGIALDDSGATYLTGSTKSPDFPTTPDSFDPVYSGGLGDVFIAKLNASGSDLVYSTYLGGEYGEGASAITIDEAGAAYVVGVTYSPNFPTTGSAFDTDFDGCSDSFVAKLSADGRNLAYSTFVGGGGDDESYDIIVDERGTAYITGVTSSVNFPTTPDSFSASYNGGFYDGFALRLNSEGSGLIYSTFLGGQDIDGGGTVAVDRMGNLYVTGQTISPDFPTTTGAFDNSINGYYDAFVSRLDASGTKMTYSTFLGGSGRDSAAITIDGSDAIFLAGTTESPDFPTTIGALDTSHNGGVDTFFARLHMAQEPPPVDLSISHIEITQATQDWYNSYDMVRGKDTWVRVYVDCGEGCESVGGVTAELYGYDGWSGDAPELPGPLTHSINGPIVAYHVDDPAEQRSRIDATLLFTLPLTWHVDQLAVKAIVNPEHSVPETDYENNESEAFSAVFENREQLDIAYVPIVYDPPLQPPTMPSDRLGEYQWFMRKVYPLADMRYIPWPGLTWSTPLDIRTCYNPSFGLLVWRLRYEFTLAQLSFPYLDQMFGWLPEGAAGECAGWSDPSFDGGWGHVAIAEDAHDAPQLLAHEIAHNYGCHHPNTADSCEAWDKNTDWLWPDSYIQEFGFDGRSPSGQPRAVHPETHQDLMSYCTNSMWVSPFTYYKLYDALVPGFQPDVEGRASTSLTTSQIYLLASGTISTSGAVALDRFWQIPSTLSTTGPTPGDYCLDLLDAADQPLQSTCFSLVFQNPASGESLDSDFFVLTMPYEPEATRVILRRGAEQLADVARSEHAPVVHIVAPNGGETWSGGPQSITWTAEDADNDPLQYTVFYSPDGGDTRWPIASRITTTSFVVDSDQLAGGSLAWIQVLASDGLNQGEDVPDGLFTVADKVPQPVILTPMDGATVDPGYPLLLWADVYDLEDGSLDDTALTWTSDRNGPLGMGHERIVSGLDMGWHTITLTARDSYGHVSTASVRIHVGWATHLPLIVRAYNSP